MFYVVALYFIFSAFDTGCVGQCCIDFVDRCAGLVLYLEFVDPHVSRVVSYYLSFFVFSSVVSLHGKYNVMRLKTKTPI